ncbi:hypothetical protein HK101_005705 [Irineochytrium annulatum]|nr:hypothetical protein HK101_005705 [Irineochytrium annulatum]
MNPPPVVQGDPTKGYNPVSGEAIQHNIRILNYTRSTLAAVAGAAAGILGLQGLSGFYFYLLASALMSAMLHVYSAKGQPGKYLVGWWMVLTHEVVGSMFSYVLFWTLFYGLVHVYASG